MINESESTEYFRRPEFVSEDSLGYSAEYTSSKSEREILMESYANTPMTYIGKDGPQTVSGSSDAMNLCFYLQGSHITDQYLSMAFAGAADTYVQLQLETALVVPVEEIIELQADEEESLVSELEEITLKEELSDSLATDISTDTATKHLIRFDTSPTTPTAITQVYPRPKSDKTTRKEKIEKKFTFIEKSLPQENKQIYPLAKEIKTDVQPLVETIIRIKKEKLDLQRIVAPVLPVAEYDSIKKEVKIEYKKTSTNLLRRRDLESAAINPLLTHISSERAILISQPSSYAESINAVSHTSDLEYITLETIKQSEEAENEILYLQESDIDPVFTHTAEMLQEAIQTLLLPDTNDEMDFSYSDIALIQSDVLGEENTSDERVPASTMELISTIEQIQLQKGTVQEYMSMSSEIDSESYATLLKLFLAIGYKDARSALDSYIEFLGIDHLLSMITHLQMIIRGKAVYPLLRQNAQYRFIIVKRMSKIVLGLTTKTFPMRIASIKTQLVRYALS